MARLLFLTSNLQVPPTIYTMMMIIITCNNNNNTAEVGAWRTETWSWFRVVGVWWEKERWPRLDWLSEEGWYCGTLSKGRQKTGAAGKECNDEEFLKGRLEFDMRWSWSKAKIIYIRNYFGRHCMTTWESGALKYFVLSLDWLGQKAALKYFVL